jgi:integrase
VDAEVESVSLAAAQRYAARRSREGWNGKPITGATVLKELKTLRYTWKWAQGRGHIAAPCPWKLGDLQLDKDTGREPFRTMGEIRRRIARGGLDAAEQERLWECMFLTREEVREVLEYAREHASAGFAYPMLCFAALSGARRSELVRARIDDFDFENRVVHVRERKRHQRKTETIRSIDLHATLQTVMQAWFADHPGGQFALAQDDGAPVSIDLARAHLKKTLAGHEQWAKIPGFHTFRHSFASILAMREVDQRIIDQFMGHQTREMRERYQHLFPKSKRRAIDELG